MLGNFVNRVTKFCVARFDGVVPGEGEYGADEHALIAELDKRIAQYTDHMENAEFRKAMGEMRAIWVAGNEYMTRAAPWTHIKTDRTRAAVGVRMGLNLIHQFAHLLWPVMPNFARKLAEQVKARGRDARHIKERTRIGDELLAEARTGDRVLIMGARDDTLIDFAQDLVEKIGARSGPAATRQGG